MLLLVQAGNLAQLVSGWIATSLCLAQVVALLSRSGRRAARKKLIFTRLGAVSLTAAQSSEAETIAAVVLETLRAETSERRGRLGDNGSLEQQKREGYF